MDLSKLKGMAGPPFMRPPIGKMATFLILHQLLIANILIPIIALDLLLAWRDFIRGMYLFLGLKWFLLICGFQDSLILINERSRRVGKGPTGPLYIFKYELIKFCQN